MSNLRVEIVGNRSSKPELGHLGQVLADSLGTREDIILTDAAPIDAVIHCRKVRDSIQAVIDGCQSEGALLLQLSTGMEYELPEDMNFTLVEAPNICVRVLKFMIELETWAAQYEGWERTIVEHHQEAKTSLPGTAVAMANILGVRHTKEVNGEGNDIVSVRDWGRSKAEFDIPDKHEGGYGIHKITFKNPEGGADEVKVIKVLGREEYAEGVYDVLQAFQNAQFREKFHNQAVHIMEVVREMIDMEEVS